MLVEQTGVMCREGNCDWFIAKFQLGKCAECLTCGKRNFDGTFMKKVEETYAKK